MIESRRMRTSLRVFDQPLCLLDHHFRHLNVTLGWFVERRRNHFTVDRALHVGDFFGPLVDQQHD